ncbi:hypothetical protein HMPREF9413_5552 [Paenibacillus sp. HGF7]|nr:hypothetical protein HMPREF9413_5552 [Paenibacillus sp. HGF7]
MSLSISSVYVLPWQLIQAPSAPAGSFLSAQTKKHRSCRAEAVKLIPAEAVPFIYFSYFG